MIADFQRQRKTIRTRDVSVSDIFSFKFNQFPWGLASVSVVSQFQPLLASLSQFQSISVLLMFATSVGWLWPLLSSIIISSQDFLCDQGLICILPFTSYTKHYPFLLYYFRINKIVHSRWVKYFSRSRCVYSHATWLFIPSYISWLMWPERMYIVCEASHKQIMYLSS